MKPGDLFVIVPKFAKNLILDVPRMIEQFKPFVEELCTKRTNEEEMRWQRDERDRIWLDAETLPRE